MIYEITNPSDPYTFIAPNREIAALAIFLLHPAFGATTEDENADERVPIFIFGGAEEWYAETFGRTVAEGIAENEAAVADALESVSYGHPRDRRRYDLALSSIDDPEKRKMFVEEWNDARSSLNDIGGAAHSLAAAIRRKMKARSQNEQT